MPRTVIALVCFVALSSPSGAASAEDDITRAARVRAELGVSGAGQVIVVVGDDDAVRERIAGVIGEVAPDAEIMGLGVSELARALDLDGAGPGQEHADVVVAAERGADLLRDESALDALVAAGALIVVPAGDDGRGALMDGPRVPQAIVVAATSRADVATATLDVRAPASVAGRFGVRPIDGLGRPLATGARVSAAIEVWHGCAGAAAPVTEAPAVWLVSDAACNLGPLVASAHTAGAAALLVASPPGAIEGWEPGWQADVALPVLAVDGALAARLTRTRAAGTVVTVELEDALVADQRLVDTVLHASTRGPTFIAGAPGAEPTLSRGPDLAAPGADTAEAAAHVAGAIALVREARPTWDAAVVRARLVTTAAPAWSAPEPLLGGNPSAGAGGVRAPLSMAGAGRVDVWQALAGDVGVVALADGGALDLGLVRAAQVTTVTRTFTLHNDGEAAVEATLEAAFRDASDARGGVRVNVPATVSVPAGGDATVTVSFTIDPDALPEAVSIPASPAVTGHDAVLAQTADEVDGWVRVSAGGARVAVPMWLLPRRAAQVHARADACLAAPAFDVALDNDGATGRSELFSLLAPASDAGVGALAAVGVRVVESPAPALEIGVGLGGAPSPMRHAVAALVDGDRDGTVDRILLAAPEHLVAGGLATGRLVSAVLTPAEAGAVALPWGRFDVVEARVVVADPLGPARVLSGSLAALGLAADAAPGLVIVALDVPRGLDDATLLATLPSGATPGATLSATLVADPACAYTLTRGSLEVDGRAALTLASGPTCASGNAPGLLALHLHAAASDVVEAIVPSPTPVYSCDPAIVVTADPDTCTASPDFRGHVHGPCAGAVTAAPLDAAPLALGMHALELVIEDPWGHRATCDTTVEVADLAAPVIDCGTIDIEGGFLPLDHTVGASDGCGGAVTIDVVGARCLVADDDEITHALLEGCAAELDGAKLRVVAVSELANLFEWSVSATDARGNEAQTACYATVGRETVGAVGGGGCAGGGAGAGFLVMAFAAAAARIGLTRTRGRASPPVAARRWARGRRGARAGGGRRAP